MRKYWPFECCVCFHIKKKKNKADDTLSCYHFRLSTCSQQGPGVGPSQTPHHILSSPAVTSCLEGAEVFCSLLGRCQAAGLSRALDRGLGGLPV